MRQVKFTRDYKFASDGINMDAYQAGQEAVVTDSCADSAVQSGAAEYLDVEPPLVEAPAAAVQAGKGKRKKS